MMNYEHLTIKDCQQAMLELLLFIDQLCQEMKLEYWLDGGTLLGAVRHQGFIPWDDDTDICLFYPDFVKLQQKLREACKDHPYYVAYGSAKREDIWVENLGDTRILNDGIWPAKIDIIGVKSVEDTPRAIANDKSIVNISNYFKAGRFKVPEDVLPEHQDWLPPRKSELLSYKNRFFQYFHQEYLPALVDKKPSHKYTYSFNDMMVSKNRDYYTYSDIFPIQKIEFAGHQLACPNQPDSYLRLLYGDHYMTPPPKEAQKPYSGLIIKNRWTKETIEQRLADYFKREYYHVIARSAPNLPLRLLHKFRSFCALILSRLKSGDIAFIYIFLRYSAAKLGK